jgi:L-alanine-DL-glutamate epimerase-like enolase superfamily enzyme
VAVAAVPIDSLHVAAYTVPTDGPESDGTLEWDSTTIVVVQVSAGGVHGVGYSYTDVSAAVLIDGRLRNVIIGADACSPDAIWQAGIAAVRNLGVQGIAASAISAVDAAVWDLKGKLLDTSVLRLLGSVRSAIPVYGSGGFTSYTDERLASQLRGWMEQGIGKVKMKVGREPWRDLERVRSARAAIGTDGELFVDANGAYTRKQALRFAQDFAAFDVVWFEEPVVSDDLEGLHLLRDRVPPGMNVSAGEYGFDLPYFRRMLAAGAVDVLQADATRCLGITGFMQAANLCEAYSMPLSAHTAPGLHAHTCCAAKRAIHVEYFYDHTRIESLFFDGALEPVGGALWPDTARPGFGLVFKQQDAVPYLVWQS